MLENKNSEAGFRQQFELYQLRLKEEEERKEKERKEEERKEEERKEERQRVAWLSKHKENVAAMGSDELQAYVRKHFDQQRTLLNHQGEKKSCDGECDNVINSQHVLS